MTVQKYYSVRLFYSIALTIIKKWGCAHSIIKKRGCAHSEDIYKPILLCFNAKLNLLCIEFKDAELFKTNANDSQLKEPPLWEVME